MERKRKSNPLLDSVLELKKLEFECDMMLAYEAAQKELNEEEFEEQMNFIAEEIKTLQKEAVEGTTYFIAGLLLSLPPDDDVTNALQMTKDEYGYYARLVKAAIHWGKLKGYK